MIQIISGARPSIPVSAPKALKTLITTCWHQNPDMRPSFSQIVQDLKNIDLSPNARSGIKIGARENSVSP